MAEESKSDEQVVRQRYKRACTAIDTTTDPPTIYLFLSYEDREGWMVVDSPEPFTVGTRETVWAAARRRIENAKPAAKSVAAPDAKDARIAELEGALRAYAECSDECTCGDGWNHEMARAALATKGGQ